MLRLVVERFSSTGWRIGPTWRMEMEEERDVPSALVCYTSDRYVHASVLTEKHVAPGQLRKEGESTCFCLVVFLPPFGLPPCAPSVMLNEPVGLSDVT